MAIKICPECGGKVSTSRNVCIHCGYVFPKTKKCPDCGENCPLDAKECSGCGYLFDDVSGKPVSEGAIPQKDDDKGVFHVSGGVLLSYSGSESEVRIPDGILSVGNAAFKGNLALAEATFPDSVTSIGDEAFFGCANLKEIENYSNVASFGRSAFEGAGLVEIEIGPAVTSIGECCFSNMKSLERLVYKPNKVLKLKNAFCNCPRLIDIEMDQEYFFFTKWDSGRAGRPKGDDRPTIGDVFRRTAYMERFDSSVNENICPKCGGALTPTPMGRRCGCCGIYFQKDRYWSHREDKKPTENAEPAPSPVSVPSGETASNEETSLSCPYCHSGELMEIGKGFYLCLTCKMRFLDVQGGSAGVSESATYTAQAETKPAAEAPLETSGSAETEASPTESIETKKEGAEDILTNSEEKVAKRKKKAKIMIIASASVALVAAVLLTTFLYIVPEIWRTCIINVLDEKDYDAAESFIRSSGHFWGYYALENMYWAGRSFEGGDFEEGIDYVVRTGGDVSVTYDGDGGVCRASQTLSAAYGTSIDNDPKKNGYTFTGWSLTSYSLNSRAHHASLNLKAAYDMDTYSITYFLNGGENNSSNPTSYTVESSDITLLPATREGYSFAGWSDGSSIVSVIENGTYGDLALTAQWSPVKHNLYAYSSDSSAGFVSVKGEGYTNETITVLATSTDGYVFKGWYDSHSNFLSIENPYSFVMPSHDLYMWAKLVTKAEAEEEERLQKLGVIPAINLEDSVVSYGLYPQTRVSDETTIASLDSLTSVEDNGWYLLNGEYYAKKEAAPYLSDSVFDDGETIVYGTTYWFKCEPITWKILSSENGEYSLVSTVLLDAHRYNDYWSGTDSDGFYANNYERSEIRSWLNGDFYNSAFSLGDSNVLETTVDNSAASTDSSSGSYACANTTDKVYLLSYQDYINADYGFPTSFYDYEAAEAARGCKTTDWARANGAGQYTGSSYPYNGDYWTRSPFDTIAWLVGISGRLDWGCLYWSEYCARPAITIKVS